MGALPTLATKYVPMAECLGRCLQSILAWLKHKCLPCNPSGNSKVFNSSRPARRGSKLLTCHSMVRFHMLEPIKNNLYGSSNIRTNRLVNSPKRYGSVCQNNQNLRCVLSVVKTTRISFTAIRKVTAVIVIINIRGSRDKSNVSMRSVN